MQLLRSFLHLQLNSVSEPVGDTGRGKGGGSRKKQRGRDPNDVLVTGKGSQLTRKQRKVCWLNETLIMLLLD